MRKLDKEEIMELRKREAIKLFGNFDQLLNDKTDQEAAKSFPYTFSLEYMNADSEVYDLGSGYLLITSKENFHKFAASVLKEDVPKFEHTSSICRLI